MPCKPAKPGSILRSLCPDPLSHTRPQRQRREIKSERDASRCHLSSHLSQWTAGRHGVPMFPFLSRTGALSAQGYQGQALQQEAEKQQAIRCQESSVGSVSTVKIPWAQTRLYTGVPHKATLLAQCEFVALMGKIKGSRAAEILFASYRNSEWLMSRLGERKFLFVFSRKTHVHTNKKTGRHMLL